MSGGNRPVSGGLYLVLDPKMERNILLDKLKQSLDGGADIIQIWNSWPESFTRSDKESLAREILAIAENYQAAVIINEEWELLVTTPLAGVHFDAIPGNYTAIQSAIDRDFLAGITCGNDLSVIEWADANRFDYISFCAMFPSSSVDSCEIVRPETVRKARRMTRLPIFVSGGITVGNLAGLQDLGIDGAAVISGILSSDTPRQAAGNYKDILDKLKRRP